MVIGVLAAVWYLDNKQKARRVSPPRPTTKAISAKKEVKPKKIKADARDGQDARTKGAEQPVATLAQDVATTPQDEIDNKEFARQLTNAKAGTIMSGKTKEGPRQKSVKQSRAQEKQAVLDTSSDSAANQSSALAADADDDSSSVNSTDARRTQATPFTNGISDMLEKPAAGPSVLRVTEPSKPLPAKKAQVASTPQPVETKKQRQNRKKAEANKLLQAEAEVERKRLEEKQRRSAREAEGRAAKDGQSFMAAQASNKSAWPVASSTAPRHVDQKENGALLDTLSSSSSQHLGSSSTNPSSSGNSKSGKWSGLPSEEEQMRFSIEESQNWEVVKPKADRRKKGKGESSGDKDSSSVTSTEGASKPLATTTKPTVQSEPHAAPALQPRTNKAWNQTVSYHEDGKYHEKNMELVDDEWEVS